MPNNLIIIIMFSIIKRVNNLKFILRTDVQNKNTKKKNKTYTFVLQKPFR